jgi:hypothetical protein
MQGRKFFEAMRAKGEVGGSMTDVEREALFDDILNNKHLFDESDDERLHGKSLAELIEIPDFVFYFGMVNTFCYNNDNGRVTRQRNVCVRRSN